MTAPAQVSPTTAPGLAVDVWTPVLAAAPPLPALPAAGAAVTVVAAHPDDETLGAGGLLQALGRRGVRVTMVLATDGEAAHPGRDAAERAELATRRVQECRRALDVLGLTTARLVRLRLPDGGVERHDAHLPERLVPLLAGSVLCLAPWVDDPHPDHRAAGRAAAAACTAGAPHAPALWQYPVWMRHSVPPGLLDPSWRERLHVLRLDEPARTVKAAAVHCHSSQIRSPHPEQGPVLPGHVLELFSDGVEPFFTERVTPVPA